MKEKKQPLAPHRAWKAFSIAAPLPAGNAPSSLSFRSQETSKKNSPAACPLVYPYLTVLCKFLPMPSSCSIVFGPTPAKPLRTPVTSSSTCGINYSNCVNELHSWTATPTNISVPHLNSINTNLGWQRNISQRSQEIFLGNIWMKLYL